MKMLALHRSSRPTGGCKFVNQADTRTMDIACRVGQLGDAVVGSEPIQPQQRSNALPSRELQRSGTVSEQYPPELTLTEQRIEFRGRHIDQEQHQNPELDECEPM